MKKHKKRKNNLSSRAVFTIKGLNQEKIFNLLSGQVNIFNLERNDKLNTVFEVSTKDVKVTKKHIQNGGLEIVNIKFKGFAAFLKKALVCYGVIFALVISSALYSFQYQYYWRCEINGVYPQLQQEIELFIKNNVKNNKKSLKNAKNLEKTLKNNFEEVSSISISYVGQTMIININEAVIPEEMSGAFRPIISPYDCMITGIELVSGSAKVHVGQIVRAGDVLVEGKSVDAQGNERDIRPIAKIYADVFLTEEVRHCESYYETVRTGRKVKSSTVSLFGLPIYSHSENHDFKQFEEEKTQKLLTKNLILPFVLTSSTVYEVETNLINIPFSDVREQKIEEARKKLLQNVEKNEIIKNETYNIICLGGIYYIDYTICVNREIGENNDQI